MGMSVNFALDDAITREQMAAVLYRYATYKNYSVRAEGSLATYSDKPSDWALTSMSWAVAEGLLQGSDGRLAPEAGATRAQAAVVLQRFMENMTK